MTSALIDRGGHRKISGGLTQPLLSFSVGPSNSAGLVQSSHGPIQPGYLRVKSIRYIWICNLCPFRQRRA